MSFTSNDTSFQKCTVKTAKTFAPNSKT